MFIVFGSPNTFRGCFYQLNCFCFPINTVSADVHAGEINKICHRNSRFATIIFLFLNDFLSFSSLMIPLNTSVRTVLKSIERSEDSYIGLPDFFCFFFRKNVKILMHLGIYALFEFN